MNAPTEESLRRTVLHAWHASHGARLVPFAGWEMPVQYQGIIQEHEACRKAAALFDVSHMGRIDFVGSDVATWLDGLVTRRVVGMPDGAVRYSLVCHEQGGVLDDVLIYRLPTADGVGRYSLVVNASNRDKLVAWFKSHGADGSRVALLDRTWETAMIAVQGPLAIGLVAQWLGWDPGAMKYYTAQMGSSPVGEILIGRTGYTGEDGVELVVGRADAERVWSELLALGADRGVQAAGLGARDTLRLEAGMPLYGHELTEDRTAAAAGLDFAIQLKDREFVGSRAIAAVKAAGGVEQRVGLALLGKRPAREGCGIVVEERTVGVVTSGTFSPTLGRPIAMGYVEASLAREGTEVEIDIRGSRHTAQVVALPFYRRSTNG